LGGRAADDDAEMRYRIRWTRLALDDLREIRDYVKHDSPAAARRLAGRFRAAIQRVAAVPRSGRMVPEFQRESLREVIVRPYRMIYAIGNLEIHVLRVWHSRRDVPEVG
jgi:addiction module RelE/StbE family toxin